MHAAARPPLLITRVVLGLTQQALVPVQVVKPCIGYRRGDHGLPWDVGQRCCHCRNVQGVSRDELWLCTPSLKRRSMDNHVLTNSLGNKLLMVVPVI